MKYNYKHILAAITLILLGSCADNSLLDFQVTEPESIAQLKYLNDYDVLKSYVDRTTNPNFKELVFLYLIIPQKELYTDWQTVILMRLLRDMK